MRKLEEKRTKRSAGGSSQMVRRFNSKSIMNEGIVQMKQQNPIRNTRREHKEQEERKERKFGTKEVTINCKHKQHWDRSMRC
jgi:hypothetical protein